MSNPRTKRGFLAPQVAETPLAAAWSRYEAASLRALQLDDAADEADTIVGKAHPYPAELTSIFGEDWIEHSNIRDRFGFGSPDTVRLGATLNDWLQARAQHYMELNTEDMWASAQAASEQARALLERAIGTPAITPADLVLKVRAASILNGKGDPVEAYIESHWSDPHLDAKTREQGLAWQALYLDAQIVAAGDRDARAAISPELARLIGDASAARKMHARAVTTADCPPPKQPTREQAAAVTEASDAVDAAHAALIAYTPTNPQELAAKAADLAQAWQLLTDEQSETYAANVARDARSALGKAGAQ